MYSPHTNQTQQMNRLNTALSPILKSAARQKMQYHAHNHDKSNKDNSFAPQTHQLTYQFVSHMEQYLLANVAGGSHLLSAGLNDQWRDQKSPCALLSLTV